MGERDVVTAADPITVITLLVLSGHEVTPQISDTLAQAVHLRVETLLTARRGPLDAAEVDRIEFTVATELMTLAVAMIARLPAGDLEAAGEALGETLVELQRMRDDRRVG